MARVNVNILGISELKWTGMGEFNLGDHYICYYGQESLRINGVAIMVNKRVRNAIFLFTTLNIASITSPIHNWVLFLLWLYPFLLSGVISSLISSTIFGTYWLGEFIFQCPIFLPFHTVHGILKARILKWFVIPFFSGPLSVRPLYHDLSVLGGPTWHGSVSLS